MHPIHISLGVGFEDLVQLFLFMMYFFFFFFRKICPKVLNGRELEEFSKQNLDKENRFFFQF